MKINKLKALALAVSATIVLPATAHASHHFESNLAREHPQFDLTDLYVFDAERPGFTAFVMDINPQTKKDGKAQFGENGVYSLHIGEDRGFSGGGLTITAHLEGDKLVFGLSKEGANQAVGVKGVKFGEAPVGTTQTFSNGVRVWSGAALDPFVGNSAGIQAFRQDIAAGKLDLGAFSKGVDLFETLNSSIIVIEVPNAMLPSEIFVYASSAFYNVDKWEQVNRLANPLMTHLFLSDNPMEVSEHVGHRPDIDHKQRYAVAGLALRAMALDRDSTVKDKVAYADKLAAELLPDVIPYEVGTPARFGFDGVNGRKLTDDAMDIQLSRFLGRPVSDGANSFDRQSRSFPYVIPIKASER
jgi:hypothetical protein